MSAPERVPTERVTPLPTAAARDLLAHGTLTVRGRIRNASNAVLFATVDADGETLDCVYKPVAGERPLWDFPDGTLAAREVAAFEVSEATGWSLIPPTVLRDGPYGEGMCQAWVGLPPDRDPSGSSDDEDDDGSGLGELFTLVEGGTPPPGWKTVGHAETEDGRPALFVHADDPRLRRLAVLDAVLNNADRKGGHLLTSRDGRLQAIDHGVTFHAEDKLRTLLWGWAGEPLTGEAVAALRVLRDALADGAPLARRLPQLLTPAEADAVRGRVGALLAAGRHPLPGGDWPAIPWPPL
ncbi:SCO1664 family protein [Streptomyces sp. RKND-216]|uniref:SCO1664 family protein n=1 Tax=Streptomyces sp. RKND-216 TaxID=2562581 RepID=UPI00109DDCEB|nr:SCO1664 family protein [Streptomyces sp. RKND-216]THA27212.1 SCO1664 family protein [Streptomyces sp. RKND-216]